MTGERAGPLVRVGEFHPGKLSAAADILRPIPLFLGQAVRDGAQLRFDAFEKWNKNRSGVVGQRLQRGEVSRVHRIRPCERLFTTLASCPRYLIMLARFVTQLSDDPQSRHTRAPSEDDGQFCCLLLRPLAAVVRPGAAVVRRAAE